MTDEEMAEEYAEANKEVDQEGFDKNKEELRQAFLAGLRTGRPKWHDLRKDPTDIPPKKDDVYSVEVWSKNARGKYGTALFSYALFEEDGRYDHWVGTIPVLWTELPKFDEE